MTDDGHENLGLVTRFQRAAGVMVMNPRRNLSCALRMPNKLPCEEVIREMLKLYGQEIGQSHRMLCCSPEVSSESASNTDMPHKRPAITIMPRIRALDPQLATKWKFKG
jgi:hypothetical protein